MVTNINGNRKKIGIIFGGCSSEYDISLQSAHSVITNLHKELYEVFLIGISKSGNWFLYEGTPDKLLTDTWENVTDCKEALLSPSRSAHGLLVFSQSVTGASYNDPHFISKVIYLDAVFPVLHGKNGEDGTVQGLLELAGIPVVGCGLLSSSLCMNKAIAHTIVEAGGIKVPASVLIRQGDDLIAAIKEIDKLHYPLFVKPVNAGSSLGITKIQDSSQLAVAIDDAIKYDNDVIVEESIEGFEVGCAIFGNQEPKVSPADEIELFVDFFDFHEKYTQHKSQIHLPARIDTGTMEKIQKTALAIYRLLCCKGFARIDMFLTPKKEIIFNEVNTIPGLTTHSRYPNMIKGLGIPYSELLDELISLEV